MADQEPMPTAKQSPQRRPSTSQPSETDTAYNTAPSPPAVIILNWNAAEDTLACVAQVAAWRSIRPHVYVVDNKSSDADRMTLSAGLARLDVAYTLIANAANQGFAGGTNRGLEAAMQAGHGPLLLLNNDARIDEAAMQQLMATLDAEPDAGVVGPLLYHEGRLLSAGHRNVATHLHTLITTPQPEPVYPVDYISGSVALIRADLLAAVGLLDERFFFSNEVADLCQRGRQAGYRTLVDQRARAVHDLGRSSALRTSLYTYYIVRNRLLYIHNAYSGAVRYGLLAGWMLYTRLLALKLRLQGQATTATAVQMALIDAQAKRWGGQNERVLAACGLRPPVSTAAPAQS